MRLSFEYPPNFDACYKIRPLPWNIPRPLLAATGL